MHERNAEAVLLLADSLLGVGRPGMAVELLRGLVAAKAGDVRVRRLLALAFLESGDYASAEPVAESLAREAVGGDLPPSLFFHARSLWGCGRLDECRRCVDQYAAALASGPA